MRADRIATLYGFHPLRRLMPLDEIRIPILMYHSISELDEPARSPYYRIGTSREVFQEQMQFLRANGYQPISLPEALEMMGGSRARSSKAVVLTFDDGYRDFYTHAFPILSEFGYSASVFLPTAYIHNAARQFNSIDCLTWSEVRELQRAGIRFGSHTVSHPELRILSSDEIRRELHNSRQTLEDKLSCPITSFSYPYAFPESNQMFVSTLRRILEETGYNAGVSTVIGTATSRYERLFLPRLPINDCDDVKLFRAKLEGGYDWVHFPQRISKSLRRN